MTRDEAPTLLQHVDPPDAAHEQPDLARRRILVAATTALGGVGIAAATVPFISSMLPSERAKAAGAPVEIDLSKLGPGTLLTVGWQGKPIWILRRTDEMLRLLETDDQRLRDPQSEEPQQPAYCKNPSRAIKPEYLVAVGLCTHLGCVPTFRPDIAPDDLGPEWRGGFYCPCHGSKFDLAGRVYKGVPAPTNLVIPRYTYSSDVQVIIGKDVG
ncbi:ubiquinol-cytochrome c reductase iron-sulfur subunit [Accumulibacter sp.]|uniref:ubiquinol-cytochrome c reductase iron-sulfur subunit n=1 Tax=Accumulibacter sp. TaxID=2053492 RepID=UPI00044577D2|nr:ubiquinol-cytochrome c reductase iron-sulfur subunit [Accumulibacter sp.]MCB1967517.1 ubiquinol-cytochrome c reductase iron-sulfur subunit [Accumulibacter sp.]MCP5230343.1 ubiquinol-cytochrome c reductase iron-sulfur subunit [Accumulibacter sp.]HRE71582.1 ubiquinol-cytochrome c reductase iron-sulfur subunit [Accumulibacter sp.]HRL74711.1 ubiquinol-cytochrome c reductase iron-sulfur subunit [Candidatus Accumulibacter phosphatis]